MKISSTKSISTVLGIASTVTAVSCLMLVPTVANALSVDTTTNVTAPHVDARVNTSTNTTTTQNNNAATEQARLQNIINKGNQEIARRLASLSTLTARINAATKLTSSDKATLTAEVNTTISGLNALKVQLDSETTITAARADAQNIYTEYRVYALVAPKIGLVKVADDQQVVEQKLQTLIQKFQTRLNALKSKGKNVDALQETLTDMTNKVNASLGISTSIQAKVIGLQPTDYNSDHAILSGDSAQLKTAHADNEAAFQDAKQIVAGIKSL